MCIFKCKESLNYIFSDEEVLRKLKDREKVTNALDYILTISNKYWDTLKKKARKDLLLGLIDYEHVRADENKLVWKITGMMEQESDVRLFMDNLSPDHPVMSFEHGEGNTSASLGASIMLNISTSSNTFTPNSTSTPPSSSTSPSSSISSSTSTSPNTCTPPSNSTEHSTSSTPRSTGIFVADSKDTYHTLPIKQEVDSEEVHCHQIAAINHCPGPVHWAATSPRQKVAHQQQSYTMPQEHLTSASSSLSFRGEYFDPSDYRQYAPLSSSLSPSHSQGVLSRITSSTSRVSENFMETSNDLSQFGLDLRLRGVNAYQKYEAKASSAHRIPAQYPRNHVQFINKMSPTHGGAEELQQLPSPQDASHRFPVNIHPSDYNALQRSCEELSKEVIYLRKELRKKEVQDMQRSSPRGSTLQNASRGFTSTGSYLSESASSPYFRMVDHPEVTRALSTKELSRLHKIPSYRHNQLHQISPLGNNSSSSSQHSFLSSPDMPENINSPPCDTFQSFRNLSDQITIQPRFQANRKPYEHHSSRTSTPTSLQDNHYNPVYTHYSSSSSESFTLQASSYLRDNPSNPASSHYYDMASGTFTSSQDEQHKPASTLHYPIAPSASLTLQTAHSTISPVHTSIIGGHSGEDSKRSDAPETAFRQLKKQPATIGLKKKWLQAHLQDAA